LSSLLALDDGVLLDQHAVGVLMQGTA
jgi:hypothetical protein